MRDNSYENEKRKNIKKKIEAFEYKKIVSSQYIAEEKEQLAQGRINSPILFVIHFVEKNIFSNRINSRTLR